MRRRVRFCRLCFLPTVSCGASARPRRQLRLASGEFETITCSSQTWHTAAMSAAPPDAKGLGGKCCEYARDGA